MPRPRPLRKEKRTFSLSPNIVSYLESVRNEQRRPSLSAVLEEIVRREQEQKEMDRISASVTRYYDSITDEERAENLAWAKFAETQFPSED